MALQVNHSRVVMSFAGLNATNHRKAYGVRTAIASSRPVCDFD